MESRGPRYRSIIATLVLSVAVMAGLVLYGGIDGTLSAFKPFPLATLAMALALVTGNYALRLGRWFLYARVLGVTVPLRANALIFLAGLTMVVTPGRVGELVKSYWLLRRYDVPLTSSVPMVAMERLLDVFAIGLLALAGLTAVTPAPQAVMVLLLIPPSIVAIMLFPKCLRLLLPIPGLRRWGQQINTSSHAFQALATPKVAALGLAAGVLGWFGEALAFWLILRDLGAVVHLAQTASVFAFSTIAGAVSLLPGGIASTEGSMVGLLRLLGVPEATAASATLLVRLCTLWFAVALGLMGLAALTLRSSAKPTLAGNVAEHGGSSAGRHSAGLLRRGSQSTGGAQGVGKEG